MQPFDSDDPLVGGDSMKAHAVPTVSQVVRWKFLWQRSGLAASESTNPIKGGAILECVVPIIAFEHYVSGG